MSGRLVRAELPNRTEPPSIARAGKLERLILAIPTLGSIFADTSLTILAAQALFPIKEVAVVTRKVLMTSRRDWRSFILLAVSIWFSDSGSQTNFRLRAARLLWRHGREKSRRSSS